MEGVTICAHSQQWEIAAQRLNYMIIFVTSLGLGPGGSPFHSKIAPGRGHCVPSAGHGGRGGSDDTGRNVFGKPYGLQANDTLGGSGGTEISMLIS